MDLGLDAALTRVMDLESKIAEFGRARGMAPRPPTFRPRCGPPNHPSPSTGCGAHDATVSPTAGRSTGGEVGVVTGAAAALWVGSPK